jgi:hypothetical protein
MAVKKTEPRNTGMTLDFPVLIQKDLARMATKSDLRVWLLKDELAAARRAGEH